MYSLWSVKLPDGACKGIFQCRIMTHTWHKIFLLGHELPESTLRLAVFRCLVLLGKQQNRKLLSNCVRILSKCYCELCHVEY